MRLHASVDGAGPPLVLLHGFTGSAESWAPHLAALGARFTTIAVDLPGHGRSPAPDPTTRLTAVADALVTVLDDLGVARASWLGYSLGGRAALHVAVAHPARVERLVLEGASPGIADASERAARAEGDGALAFALERDGLDAFVERWMAQPLFASQRRLSAAVRARERAVRLSNSARGLALALRALGAGTQAPLWHVLPTLRLPTILVVGAEDARYRAIAEAMASRLPDAVVAVVPEAGHAPHLESPAAFADAVLAFLGAAGDPRAAAQP